MIAGLPWESWLLLLVAVGLGLGIEIAFFRAHRKERRGRLRDSGPPEEGAGATGGEEGRPDGSGPGVGDVTP